MIKIKGLKKVYKSGRGKKATSVEAVKGIDLDVARGRDLRLPRPERRRQDHHAADAGDPARARRRRGHDRRRDLRTEPGGVRRNIGYVAQGGGTTGTT